MPRHSSTQLDRVRSPPKVPEWERIAQEMRLAAERVVQGVATVDEACVALDRKTDEILEKRRWMMDKDRVHMRPQRAAWWFVAPALLVIGVFFFLPVLAALAMSLTDFDLYALSDFGDLRWIGFENYARLLREPLFWKSLGNTLYFVVLGVPLSIGVSLGAALLVNSKVARFRGFFRTMYFAPVVTTLVAVAVVWRYIFHTRYGFLNYSLASARHRAGRLDGRSALGDAGHRRPRGVEELRLQHDHPAGGAAEHSRGSLRSRAHRRRLRLAAVPPRHDARNRAGAAARQHPDDDRVFPVVRRALRDDGGRAAAGTFSVLYFMYEEGFKWWSLGRASAVAFLLFVLMFLVTVVQLRLGRERGGA